MFFVLGNYMLVYDGSEIVDIVINWIVESLLLLKLFGYVVMVGNDIFENYKCFEYVCEFLFGKGCEVQMYLFQGNVIECLMDFQNCYNIELKVMGVYGYLRI